MKYIVTHSCCYPSDFQVRIFEDYETALKTFKETRQELLDIWTDVEIGEDTTYHERFPSFCLDGGEYDHVELNPLKPAKAGGGRFQYVA